MSDLISKEEAVAILLEAKEAGCVDKYTNAIRNSNFDEAIECIQGIPTVEAVPVETLLVQTIESMVKASEAIMNNPLRYLVKEESTKHGRWIGISDGYADGYPVYDEWECSVCGTVFEDEKPDYKYCPSCGAKMDEVE